MEWFSASFPGAPNEETIDGVRIVRAGRQWTVHWTAFRHYRGKLSARFDIVVDEVNTIPFFTPFWADVPAVMLIHQLAREVWWYESPFPISAIGFIAESLYLRSYRHSAVITVSASTKNDLRQLGFTGSITIIPEGIETVADLAAVKQAAPTFLYVGRLAPSKRISHLFRALALFRQTTGKGDLWLVGSGSNRHRNSLMKLAQRLNIAHNVFFFGRVSTEEKHRLMAQADALVMTSVREGWGLVVTEANACGTPAVVYDVPGLRDSVRHESTGLVVRPRPRDLCGAMIRVMTEPGLSGRLAAEGKRWSATLSFDESANVFSRLLDSVSPVTSAFGS